MRNVPTLTNPEYISIQTSTHDVSWSATAEATLPRAGAYDTGLQSCTASQRVSELKTTTPIHVSRTEHLF